MPNYIMPQLRNTEKVLEAIAHSKEPMTAKDIEVYSGVNKNNCFKILHNLTEMKWVECIGNHYRLGMALGVLWAKTRARLEHERDVLDSQLKNLEVDE